MNIGTGALEAAGVTGISTDEKDTTWKVNLGYQFTRHLGVEVGYVQLGEFAARGTVAGAPSSARVDVDAITFAGVGSLPIGNSQFSILGRLGGYYYNADGRGTLGGVRFTGDDDGTNLFWGFGVRYDFHSNLGVTLDWDHYRNDDKIKAYTVGLRYKF
jgi:OOP family OmpA-OmpF porin